MNKVMVIIYFSEWLTIPKLLQMVVDLVGSRDMEYIESASIIEIYGL